MELHNIVKGGLMSSFLTDGKLKNFSYKIQREYLDAVEASFKRRGLGVKVTMKDIKTTVLR